MTDSPSLSFGEELRRERLIREISLEEISHATKISVRLLKALEESDLKKLPAPTFTRGFIRAYARHLGIDPEEKVNAYLSDLADGPSDAPAAKKALPRSRFWRGRRATAGTIVGVVTAVLLLLGLIASPERRIKPVRERRVAPRAASVAFKNVAVSSEPTPGVADSPSVASAIDTHASGTNAVEASAADLHAVDPPAVSLTLEFEQDSWTKLEADGATVLVGIVRRGEMRRFQARGGFRLSLGNAGGVKVSVDGRALDRLGHAGEVVRDIKLPSSSRG
jgi:cytoskeletal protein RodZ